MNTDEELKQHLLSQLVLDPSINSRDIGVSVRNGVVTLNGTVPSYADKIMAAKAARCVTGVKKLTDEVMVALPDTHQRPDSRIADTALNAIKCITTVPTDRITVTAQGGRLMLGGTVESWGQKEAVEEVVRTLTGVTDVIDTIAIQPQPIQRTARNSITVAKITAAGEKRPALSGTTTFVWRASSSN